MTHEHIKEYYDYYVENKSLIKTTKHFHKCGKELKRLFVNSGFKYPLDNFNSKHNLNREYFKDINTERKAYFLGFIFADGSIYERQRYQSFESCLFINISNDDRSVIEEFAKDIEFDGKFEDRQAMTFIAPNGKEYTRKSQCRVSISSKEFVSYLKSFGLDSRKTYLELNIPNLSKELLPHFIRGYFDGDGCISCTKSQDKYKGKIDGKIYHGHTIQFTSKKSNFLLELKNLLENEGIRSGIHHDKNRDVYILFSNSKDSVIKFKRYLYDNSNIHLDRKKIKFDCPL